MLFCSSLRTGCDCWGNIAPIDACALIDEPNSYGIEWTSVRIWQIVNESFSPHTRFYTVRPEGPVISDPFEIDEHSEADVIELEGGRGYAFDYALPLNGE